MKTNKQLKEEWKQYIADHPKWYRSFNTSHHYFRCRYASKFFLNQRKEDLEEIKNWVINAKIMCSCSHCQGYGEVLEDLLKFISLEE